MADNIVVNIQTLLESPSQANINQVRDAIQNAIGNATASAGGGNGRGIRLLDPNEIDIYTQRMQNAITRLQVGRENIFSNQGVQRELTTLQNMLNSVGTASASTTGQMNLQFDNLRTRVAQTANEFRNVNRDGYSFVEMMTLAAKKFVIWQVAVGGVMLVWREFKNGISFLNELNASMTNIQMITGRSHDQVVQMTQDYADLAAQLHDTIGNVSKASEEFLRAGHNQEETLKLLQASTVMSKISGEDQKATADQLIAITNGYKMNINDVMDVVDKLTTVDNMSATSTRELGLALERTSSSAQMAGTSFTDLVSYIATVSSVSRKSASSIGESFKTIFAR